MADDRDAALRARIDALEAAVAELRVQLAQARPGRFGAMRDTRRCPACGGGALLHFRRIHEKDDHMLVPLGLTHHEAWFSNNARAPLETFACRGCGLVEWHAANFDGVEPDGEHIVAIEPEGEPPAGGPFR